MIKNVKLAELNAKIVFVFFEYINFQDSLIEYKFLCCNKNHQKKLNESLKKRLVNT